MSFFPSPVLVRLQELRLWQGNYDSLLQNKTGDGTTNNPSDYETIEGLSALDSTHSTPVSSPDREKDVDWDKRTISPAKPFEQLLEEKLAEDEPVQVQPKPKRPFLKKGAGLTRYKLNPRPVPQRNAKKPICVSISEEKPTKSEKPSIKTGHKKRSISPKQRSWPKSNVSNTKVPEVDLTPLTMPNLIVKPKATWQKVLEEKESDTSTEKVIEDANKNTDGCKVNKNHMNSHIIGKINEFALRHFLHNPKKKADNLNKSNDSVNSSEVDTSSIKGGNQTLYERSVEKELRIFEALEERAEHSSFSSTNSSILRLLSSTPNKKNKLLKSPIIGKRKISGEIQPPLCEKQTINLQDKLAEINKKSDVLHDFLDNLRKIGGHSNKASSHGSGELAKKVIKYTPDTSFSDEEKWSSTDQSHNVSQSSGYTDADSTYREHTLKTVNTAVNTSFTDNDDTKTEKCARCEELQNELEKVSKKIPDIQAEKAKVCDFAKELETKRDQLNKEMQKMKKQHEHELRELREELESEKKKFTREKMVFDTYIKDSHNRPSRKEREELSNLKKELIDAKELLKMKDVKNGATQARLRNQIKQLEKENYELKTNVEKLQKENAKLNANHLVRRPSEVKMLHEINKNLSKLTEETFKKQLNKNETTSDASNNNEVKKVRRGSKERDESEEREAVSKVKKKHVSFSKNKTQDETTLTVANETNRHDMTTFANLSLEKQYENVFGQFPSSMQNNSLNESKKEKTERVFEDGSKEIKYSNGNTKTISPDGNLVVVKYYNGDIKETDLQKNTLKYYYAENATWHTQFGDGTEILEYPNGQKEKKFSDGRKEVTCADGSFLTILPDGTEEILYPDGSKIVNNLVGEKILLLPNGQKEIHTKEHKRREYPDGTVKILYPDGTQETRYASGRIRIKDVNGLLLMDSLNLDS